MSIQLFKNKYGIIPELNARDDSAGMEIFHIMYVFKIYINN